ncbi:zinc ribbon domain-containing protein [Heliophilum fasciatum]|uniref:Double zinc ribbon protein n=1 Tax=Heliophilum fasciatum TaxID=35700 RepID=A0A4R2RIJ4_9FIRM|nr:zinc ribbon domain-containing protein [Heliophilum fasciatum]MCW2278481.1 RNA polymerase subunit RPABC4/transcription elongation factor Spt4 [Heliophilum fasciatum]TCP63612.1 double zinc ribbon protein [Heliophilum fasciatum]
MQCTRCQRMIQDDFRFCPHCGTETAPARCPGCGKTTNPDWAACPYCGVALKGAPPRPAAFVPPAAPMPPHPPVHPHPGGTVFGIPVHGRHYSSSAYKRKGFLGRLFSS